MSAGDDLLAMREEAQMELAVPYVGARVVTTGEQLAAEQQFTRNPADCEALWYRATFGRHLQAVQVRELSPGIRERRFVEGPQ